MTIMDIVHTLLSHILVILLVGAIAGAAAWAYTTYKIPKMYKVTVTFYARSKVNEEPSDVTSSNLTTDRQLASTYSYVLRSNSVMKEAESRLDAKNIRTPTGSRYTYNVLKSMTSVSTTNTEIFTATFTSSDKENLKLIADTIAESGAAKIQEIIGGEAKILDEAEKPGAPYSPDVKANTITGVAIGLLIASAIFVIRALTDTTIWSEEDLSKQYSIPVLGSVPQLFSTEKQTAVKEKE